MTRQSGSPRYARDDDPWTATAYGLAVTAESERFARHREPVRAWRSSAFTRQGPSQNQTLDHHATLVMTTPRLPRPIGLAVTTGRPFRRARGERLYKEFEMRH